jgi:hypothetical protein
VSGPEPIDVAQQRSRLIWMVVVNAVCVVVAAGAAVGFLSFRILWLGAVFAGAVIVGFSAQIWLVLGLRRRN